MKPRELPPSKVQVLIDNYRESREEGIKLVHSVFNDIAFSVALLGTIISGGTIAREPKLQLIIPILLGGIFIYEIQKFRVNNLITCYMIYLENKINQEYSNKIMIWNSEIIRKNVSAGRQSKWGYVILFFGIIIAGVLYGGVCYWAINLNMAIFSQGLIWQIIYIGVCLAIFIVNIIGVIRVLSVTRQCTPDYIESQAQKTGIGIQKNNGRVQSVK